jgi:hypothetical protein
MMAEMNAEMKTNQERLEAKADTTVWNKNNSRNNGKQSRRN